MKKYDKLIIIQMKSNVMTKRNVNVTHVIPKWSWNEMAEAYYEMTEIWK